MLACKKCMLLTEQEKCPLCGGELSKEWQGMLVVVDHGRSKIAEHMGIKVNGKYALKVR
ncbi:MAG: transcription elongation factor subunit Spt4 [Thermoplasmatota archaeon]